MKADIDAEDRIDPDSALELSQFLIVEIEAAKKRRRQIWQWITNSVCLLALGVVSWGAWHRDKAEFDDSRQRGLQQAEKFQAVYAAAQQRIFADKWRAGETGHPDEELFFRVEGLSMQGAYGVQDADWERRRRLILDYWPLKDFPFATTEESTLLLGLGLVKLHRLKMNEESVVTLRRFAAKIKSERFRSMYKLSIEKAYNRWLRQQAKTKKNV